MLQRIFRNSRNLYAFRRSLAFTPSPTFYNVKVLSFDSQIQSYAKKKKKKGKIDFDDDDFFEEEKNFGLNWTDLGNNMDKFIKAYSEQLKTMKTGRASPELIEKILVDTPNGKVPVKSLGSVVVKTPRLITVSLYDKDAIGYVEKAIVDANLGFNPQKKSPTLLDVPVPKVTKEIRESLIKTAKKMMEQTKERIRGVRKTGQQQLKELKKNGMPEDALYKEEAKLNKFTEDKISQVEQLYKQKEEEISTL